MLRMSVPEHSESNFLSPPSIKTGDGSERCVGFEFELAITDLKSCIHPIIDIFGGTVKAEHSLDAKITDTSLGTFHVELDAQLIKKMAGALELPSAEAADDIFDLTPLKAQLSQLLGGIASQFVPYEIVTPPIPLSKLHMLDALVQALRNHKAKGTRDAITNAFGMHINPEIASENVEYTANTLRAFVVLYPWLIKAMDIDLTRRILPYIAPFPEEYVKRVLDENYTPPLQDFIKDYIRYNPTRNRALDLLPLFAYLSPSSLEMLSESERSLVAARPTFHYRLPNCDIDNPNWQVATDWNYWVEIEELAANPEKLASICSSYLTFLNRSFFSMEDNWLTQLGRNYGYE